MNSSTTPQDPFRKIESAALSECKDDRSLVIVLPPDEKTLSEAAEVDGIERTFLAILLIEGYR